MKESDQLFDHGMMNRGANLGALSVSRCRLMPASSPTAVVHFDPHFPLICIPVAPPSQINYYNKKFEKDLRQFDDEEGEAGAAAPQGGDGGGGKRRGSGFFVKAPGVDAFQEAGNWPNIVLQEKCHSGILPGGRNISDTP